MLLEGAEIAFIGLNPGRGLEALTIPTTIQIARRRFGARSMVTPFRQTLLDKDTGWSVFSLHAPTDQAGSRTR
jgi:hypothetical protein